jgi:hypothetical protein
MEANVAMVSSAETVASVVLVLCRLHQPPQPLCTLAVHSVMISNKKTELPKTKEKRRRVKKGVRHLLKLFVKNNGYV